MSENTAHAGARTPAFGFLRALFQVWKQQEADWQPRFVWRRVIDSVDGRKIRGGVMRRTVDGRHEYRAMTDAEATADIYERAW